MALTPSQVQELKAQLSEQIKHLPPEQREQAQEQIDSMSDLALETMLHQQTQKNPQSQKGVFRAIVDGEIPSKKVDENKEAVAVVSKMSVSPGHILVIPKKAVSSAKLLPSEVFSLAKKVAKRMSSKLKAESTEIQTENAFGEVIVHVIPVYDKPVSLSSQKHEADEKEMQEVYNKLRLIVKPKRERVKEVKKSDSVEILKLKRRVP